ncbi:hypothetical protein P245_20300 [Comamonas thiooxydans]|uniref:Uncharacterized protein n=1 Tax=Comamonas thiooxydans TaxID=363952 RepID=A0A0E3BY79_9BURK|nr:hypothetical protein P245_20300 [Comamonas thiooxydans]
MKCLDQLHRQLLETELLILQRLTWPRWGVSRWARVVGRLVTEMARRQITLRLRVQRTLHLKTPKIKTGAEHDEFVALRSQRAGKNKVRLG